MRRPNHWQRTQLSKARQRAATLPSDLTARSNVGGPATGGTHQSRKRINAIYNDWHVETMTWTTYINDQASTSDPGGPQRWYPTPSPTP